MRALSLKALVIVAALLTIAVNADRTCSFVTGKSVTGASAYAAVTATSQAICCDLCTTLPDCVGATHNASSLECRRYQKVGKPFSSVGMAYIQVTGTPVPSPAVPVQRWTASTPYERLQYGWTGVGNAFTTVDGCHQRSVATGARINGTCPTNSPMSGLEWLASFSVNNSYVLGNVVLQTPVALVYPAPGWFLNLEDGSQIFSQPIVFDALNGQPPIGVALMAVGNTQPNVIIVTAFNMNNGLIVWRSNDYVQRESSLAPFSIEKSGTVAVFSYSIGGTGYVIGFDVPTGIQLWNTSYTSLGRIGATILRSGDVAANGRYAAVSVGTHWIYTEKMFFWWQSMIVDSKNGNATCSSPPSSYLEYCQVIRGTMDESNSFAVWCAELTTPSSSFARITIELIDAPSCQIKSSFKINELQLDNSVVVQYDATTRSIVASGDSGVVAYRRDDGRQLWAYQTKNRAIVAVGAGIAIVQSAGSSSMSAFELSI